MRAQLAIAALVACVLLPADIYGQDTTRRYGQDYNGAFVDVSARVARTHVASSAFNGWAWDIGLRQALVMHLLDTRVSYSEDRFTARSGGAGDFVMRSVSIHGAFHPIYLALLFSNWLGYVLASFYVEGGIGGHYSREPNLDQDDFGLRLSLGSGFDFPLSDPDRGWSVWLNALYRYTFSDFDFDDGTEINLHHHAGWLGVSLRFNGLLF